MIMDVSGDSAAVRKLKNEGQKFPMIMNMENNVGMDIKTAMPNAQNRIPAVTNIRIQDIKMTVNGQTTPLPNILKSQVMYGSYSPVGTTFVLDSLAGKKLGDTLTQKMQKTFENYQSKIQFPNTPMKVGDTFTQDLPLNIPLISTPSDVKAKTIYTLRSIEGNKAFFDTKNNLDMALNLQGISMTVVGDGNGKMVYDITSNYATSITMNMNLNYTMNMPQSEGTKMNGRMKMEMGLQTTIIPN